MEACSLPMLQHPARSNADRDGALSPSTLKPPMCRFGKARIFVDGVELLVKRYSFLQQARHHCLHPSGYYP